MSISTSDSRAICARLHGRVLKPVKSKRARSLERLIAACSAWWTSSISAPISA
jgi:hypothetical protein